MNLKFEISQRISHKFHLSQIRYLVARDHKTINTEIEEIFQGAKFCNFFWNFGKFFKRQSFCNFFLKFWHLTSFLRFCWLDIRLGFFYFWEHQRLFVYIRSWFHWVDKGKDQRGLKYKKYRNEYTKRSKRRKGWLLSSFITCSSIILIWFLTQKCNHRRISLLLNWSCNIMIASQRKYILLKLKT